MNLIIEYFINLFKIILLYFMEINKDNEKKKSHLNSHLTYFGYFLIIVLAIYFIYIIEKYILFFPVKLIFYYILQLTNFKFESIYINVISIIIVIYLHILFIQKSILSIIFLIGGFGKRNIMYLSFKKFIELLIYKIKNIITSFKSDNFNSVESNFESILKFHKTYNQLKLNGISFEIEDSIFGDLLNELVFLYQQLKDKNFKFDKNNEKDKENNISFITRLNELNKKLFRYTQFSFIQIFTLFKFSNVLIHMSTQLLDEFSPRITNIINISNNFNAYLISPDPTLNIDDYNNNNQYNIKTEKILVIFCSQNAVCSEMNLIFKDNIKYYLDIKKVSILLWNYQGFGNRKGFTSFKNINDDIYNLVNYIRREFSEYKIIIHGISIGGYSAIKLALELDDEKNVVLISDRTFGDINLIVRDLKYGNFLESIYLFLFPKCFYNTSNIENYLKVKGNKIIFYDENDETISYSSSLIFNLTVEYFNKKICPEIKNKFNKESIICIGNNNGNNVLNYFFECKNDLEELKNDIKYQYEHKSNFNKNDDSTKYFFTKLYETKIENFVIFFLTFGFPFNKYKEIPYEKEEFNKVYTNVPIQMRKIILLYNNLLSEKVKDFLSKLNLLFVRVNLESSMTDEEISTFSYELEYNFQIKNSIYPIILNYFGYVHRIFCGHNGILKENDEEYLNDFFEFIQFISIKEEEDKVIN